MLFFTLISAREAKCWLVFCFVSLELILILRMNFFVFIKQHVIKYKVKDDRHTERDTTCKIKLTFSYLSWKPELRKLTVPDAIIKTWKPKTSFRIISAKCIPLGIFDLSQWGVKGNLRIMIMIKIFTKRMATINSVSRLLIKYRDDMPYFPNQ